MHGCSREIEGQDLACGLAFGRHLRCTLLAEPHAVAVTAAIEDQLAVADAKLVGVAAHVLPAQRPAYAKP